MPSVYSSVFTNFIRSGFSKSFTHGYAQSVVAATHPHVLNAQNRPSFARRNSSRIGRIQTIGLGLTSAFHTSASQSSVALDHRHDKSINHGGLDAYFENLQKKQEAAEEDKDWVQFQFPKRIEWKPSPAAILVGGEVRLELPADDVSHDLAASSTTGAAVIEGARTEDASTNSAAEHEPSSPASDRPDVARAVQDSDALSQTYAGHLTRLAETSRYAEIPAVFEAMLVAGVQPAATAYNALLVAAIHLPTEKIEIVSRALDVYADMKRRKVSPDADTYDVLVGLLAARSLEVSALRKVLEDKRLRFGGVDEPGKFIFASHELEHAILAEDDRLDLAITLFEASVVSGRAKYSSETYHQLISACANSGRVSDMLQLFGHMESSRAVPFAATFPAMIAAFAGSGDLVSAVECYNEYRSLAIADDGGKTSLLDRLDPLVYAAVVNAYILSDKPAGALKFYEKIVREYGVRVVDMENIIVRSGFVKAFAELGIFDEAIRWAARLESGKRDSSLAEIAQIAADRGDMQAAAAAFAGITTLDMLAAPASALLAMHVRAGDVASASHYWQILSRPDSSPTAALIEPAAMYGVALIGSGQVAEGLTESETMFLRIREETATAAAGQQQQQLVIAQIEEATEFIASFMTTRNIADPRDTLSPASQSGGVFSASPFPSTATVSSFDDTFDPYAHNTDFKGSSLISDELEGSHGRRGPRLHEALARFRNMRRAGRHPRYITYAKLISAASREGKTDLCHEILAMARADVPLQAQYAAVRYGWSSIFDAMIGACLAHGDRTQAEQYHQELLDMGSTPSANTFGLYITTLKESTNKTFDEASEAVRIFHRAKTEGVEPTSFLYNALIGKLGKARRIDDCLFYFAEMRALGIKPTSVTYGTIVNALCRVSDDKFAEELFDEMESMPNYKARPAPYNSMMQFFLTTKRDKSKVLSYYERMKAKNIVPTAHTHKLLVDAHATLEPVDMAAAEAILDSIRSEGRRPDPVHYASLIHARGCVLHDLPGARRVFDNVMAELPGEGSACLFQALFESMVANHAVRDSGPLLALMRSRQVDMTPYIANTLIHGWAAEGDVARARDIFGALGRDRREPSTYEAMTRAFLSVGDHTSANAVVSEMLSRGYPSAVVNKVLDLLGVEDHMTAIENTGAAAGISA